MPKQIAKATMEGKIKRGRPRKRRRYKFEEDLNIMGIKIQAGSGQRPLVMEEDHVGSQGVQRAAALED